MIGIDVEKLDKLAVINEENYANVKKNIEDIFLTIKDLYSCYSGKGLDFLFADINEQSENLTKITKQISNYSTLLFEVKKSYQLQDSYMTTQSK